MENTPEERLPESREPYRFMKYRIHKILLVCCSYDGYILEEDGHIESQINQEYLELNLSNPPSFTRVSSTAEALELLDEDDSYDFILTMYNVGEPDVFAFAHIVKERHPRIPIALLTSFSKDIYRRIEERDRSALDYIFCWHGNTELRRGREARAGEIQFETQGTEVGVLQLLRHIAHDAAHALGKAGVEIGKARAPAFEAAQLLFQVAPGVFVCQGVEPLRRGGGKAALRSRILRDVLEDIVDERARFRGAELRRTARSRAQAIAKEVGEAAGGQLFHPRGRKAQLLPVERAGRAL